MANGSVGSTGKGTGPMYSDLVARRGIKFRDLFNRDIFAAKVKKIYGKEYSDLGIDIDEVIEEELRLFEKVRPFVRDTKSHIQRALLENKKILIEGAQGTLLSYRFGTYPFVTSSDPTILGTAEGCDIPINCVDLVIGLIKFPVMTRVGPGPFPTEYGAGMSESYCAEGDGYENVKSLEEERFRTVPVLEMINDRDEFRRGIGLRRIMDEYGATTGRPRRTGRVDAVAGRHAVQVNSVGPRVVLASTKSDCVRGMHEIEIGTRYVYASLMMNFKTAERDFSEEATTNVFSTNADLLYRLRGEYETFDGFEEDVSGIRTYNELPIQLRAPHERFEELVGAPFGMVSIGPGTDEIIIKDIKQ
jgi:adenylosuccinate synthase